MGENELYHLVLERLSDTHKNKEREIINGRHRCISFPSPMSIKRWRGGTVHNREELLKYTY